MANRLLGLFALVVLLISCGVNNNLTVVTTNGACPSSLESGSVSLGNAAPYCMSVTVQNNNGGQNWINSSNYPISSLAIAVSGATNIQSPATTSTMDPNNCTGSTINLGNSCTFYLKLSGEAYPVTSTETATVTLTYNVNNQLFGSGTSYSTQFNVYEQTNIYAFESSSTSNGSAYLWQYNSGGLSNIGLIESGDQPMTSAIDNNNLGLAYLGGTLGIYAYGNSTTSSSISKGGITSGASNLIANASSLFASGVGTNTGVWEYSLNSNTWAGTSPAFTSGITFASNINAISGSTVLYFANGSAVYACNIPNVTTCQLEASGGGLAGNLAALDFLTLNSTNYTGLFAGTASGIFAESGISSSPSNSWTPVTTTGSGTVPNITAMAGSSTINQLYIGDSSGNIWVVNATAPTTVAQFSVGSGVGSPVAGMVVDNNGSALYFTAGNTLYSCTLGGATCSPTSLGAIGTYPVFGLNLGSTLTNSQP